MSDVNSKRRDGWVLWPDEMVSVFFLCVIEEAVYEVLALHTPQLTILPGGANELGYYYSTMRRMFTEQICCAMMVTEIFVNFFYYLLSYLGW